MATLKKEQSDETSAIGLGYNDGSGLYSWRAGAGACIGFDTDPWPTAKDGPVKVFILAGQSNMEGYAALRTLEYLIYNGETAKEYQQWKDRWGNWQKRSDVWIWTTDGQRYGNLKPG